LQDAGNTTTIASYLRLLAQAFLLAPLERFSGSRVKQRGSIPKLIVLDNALVTAMLGRRFREVRRDTALWGRLTENAVGAQPYWRAQEQGGELCYWRERHDEVDFVLTQGSRLHAIEVKSGAAVIDARSLQAFQRRYPQGQTLVIATRKGEVGDRTRQTVQLQEFFAHQRAKSSIKNNT